MRVIAHRGASWERPENTVAALERAVEIGVDAVEVDLLLSKEGRLVVRHDDLIQHDNTWSYVHELTVEELKAIDLGGGERIPLFEEVFERFQDRCPLVLDIKAYGAAQRLVAFLRPRAAKEQVHVTSFLHSEIVTFGALCPDVARSIVMASLPIKFDQLFREVGTRQVSLFRGYLTQEVILKLQRSGIRVWAYPVNLPREAQAFARWGVDAIFTDDPATMRFLRAGDDLSR